MRAFAVVLFLTVSTPLRADQVGRIPLAEGWALQSSAMVAATGDVLSKAGLDTTAWHKVAVPNTVVGALVENGEYGDPYFGMNLREIPGTTYPIGERFTLLPMPTDSPFKASWWYRGVLAPAGRDGTRTLAALRRHQLSREHLAERRAHRRRRRGARARSARYEFDITRRRVAADAQRARGRSLRARAARPGDHVGRLEPDAAGQEHGAVGRRLADATAVPSRCAHPLVVTAARAADRSTRAR